MVTALMRLLCIPEFAPHLEASEKQSVYRPRRPILIIPRERDNLSPICVPPPPSPQVFGERSGVREMSMINSTWPGSPFWRKWFSDKCLATPVQQRFHGSTRNACGCSQMGTEGLWYMACSLFLPFSFHFTGNLPHNKLCRISPSGPFLSCHLHLQSGLLGLWLPLLQTFCPNVGSSRARSPRSSCSLICLIG